MKIIDTLTVSFAIFSVFSCSSIMPEGNQNGEETNVVNALLRIEFSDCVTTNFPFVIQEKLGVYEHLVRRGSDKGTLQGYAERLAEEAEGMDERIVEAIWDFYEKNSNEWNIDSFGCLSIEHVVYTEEMDHAIFYKTGTSPSKNWNRFYEQFPDYPGIIGISRVGFSKDGSIAVVYMGHIYGQLMGGGRVYIYKKVNEAWFPSGYRFGHQWIS